MLGFVIFVEKIIFCSILTPFDSLRPKLSKKTNFTSKINSEKYFTNIDDLNNDLTNKIQSGFTSGVRRSGEFTNYSTSIYKNW